MDGDFTRAAPNLNPNGFHVRLQGNVQEQVRRPPAARDEVAQKIGGYDNVVCIVKIEIDEGIGTVHEFHFEHCVVRQQGSIHLDAEYADIVACSGRHVPRRWICDPLAIHLVGRRPPVWARIVVVVARREERIAPIDERAADRIAVDPVVPPVLVRIRGVRIGPQRKLVAIDEGVSVVVERSIGGVGGVQPEEVLVIVAHPILIGVGGKDEKRKPSDESQRRHDAPPGQHAHSAPLASYILCHERFTCNACLPQPIPG